MTPSSTPVFGIVVFPGSTGEQDAAWACECLGIRSRYLWHQECDLAGVGALILPGGFSYGDYLRPGAVACTSPIMKEVASYARSGHPVLGIGNGFQILTEAHLLEGALLTNNGGRFISREVSLSIEASCIWLDEEKGTTINLPIAHNKGAFVCDEKTFESLRENDQIILRYCALGDGGTVINPNGSLDNIAGICNKQRNVLGLMPHPELASDPACGGIDGQVFFTSALKSLKEVAV